MKWISIKEQLPRIRLSDEPIKSSRSADPLKGYISKFEKALTVDDIKSLGWKSLYVEQNNMPKLTDIGYIFYIKTNNGYQMVFDNKEKVAIFNLKTDLQLFTGKIQSKNELEVLMKQLGII